MRRFKDASALMSALRSISPAKLDAKWLSPRYLKRLIKSDQG